MGAATSRGAPGRANASVDELLQTWAAFLLGYDRDTVDSIVATCDRAIANRITFAAFNVPMPYPGTLLYARLKEAGRLLHDGRWWTHPDDRFNHAAFRPARMTPDELTEVAWACRRRSNDLASIVRRALDPRTNLSSPFRFALYCLYNPLYRRESRKRQVMCFFPGPGPGVEAALEMVAGVIDAGLPSRTWACTRDPSSSSRATTTGRP